MRRTLYSLALASLLASVGCQVPGVLARPHVVVGLNTLKAASDADLAITLDFRALLGIKTLQAVTDPAAPRHVNRIVARVTGPNIADPNGIEPVEVLTSGCPSGIAVISFSNLPPGPVHIVINTLDDAGQIITTGAADATVTPGITVDVPVQCSTELGGIKVKFTCIENCGGDPVPKPTPTPTPKPVTPVNPTAAGLANYVNGLIIDDRDNIHLMAIDPDSTPPAFKSLSNNRIIRIPADLSNSGTVYGDGLSAISFDGVFRNGRIIAGNLDNFTIAEYDAYNGNLLAQDSETFDPPDVPVPQSPQTYAPAAFALNSSNQVVTAMRNNAVSTFLIKELSSLNVAYFYSQTGGSTQFLSYLGNSLVMDEQDIPIFPQGANIYTVSPSGPSSPPTILASVPTTMPGSQFFGIAKTDEPSKYLLSLTGTTSIYLWDRSHPTDFSPANVAVTMPDGEFPHQIKRAPNGKYYVLASKEDRTSLYMNHYRVYRFDLDAGHLTNGQLLVSDY